MGFPERGFTGKKIPLTKVFQAYLQTFAQINKSKVLPQGHKFLPGL